MNPTESQQLALDTIARKPTRGIPSFLVHIMETGLIDELAGQPAGTYLEHPEKTYLQMQWNVGATVMDQCLWDNPLTMTNRGFDSRTAHGATTGAERIVLNDLVIDSPEAVVEHMERFLFPQYRRQTEAFDENRKVAEIIEQERDLQDKIGPNMLKTGYGFIPFPGLHYYSYGYANYFMAYALYPEIMERDFRLQADWAEGYNRAAARAIIEGNLPRLYRLDSDMADSRGMLVNMKSLEQLWYPHFARAVKPVTDLPDMNLIWHCDGNLMALVPFLLEAGVKGFQGFQYEAGMDYEKICRMKTREGQSLIIVAGSSVTETLPKGTPELVRKEMRWLVEKGPKVGLFLAGSSSITPGTNRENILTFVEGLKYYRTHGRTG